LWVQNEKGNSRSNEKRNKKEDEGYNQKHGRIKAAAASNSKAKEHGTTKEPMIETESNLRKAVNKPKQYPKAGRTRQQGEH